MLKTFILLLGILCTGYIDIIAQEVTDSTEVAEEMVTLNEVVVKAFGSSQLLTNVPASMNKVTPRMFERYAPLTIINAINSTPGIRMEERSPGSYRINIRGSSLRSPFGVRNVKIYYNDIPITNPGGLTFLNQLGVNNFQNVDIIKGPGSSFYGAGTGGVMLISSASSDSGFHFAYTTGSYNTHQWLGKLITRNSTFSYERTQSAGYRDHSEMKRDVFTWDGVFRLEKATLTTSFVYGDLFYETPGALTRADYNKNPKASRPATAVFPSAIAANAHVKQRSFISGASLQQPLSRYWKNRSVVYGMFTELRNPNIQNYDKSLEPHFGGRSEFQFQKRIRPGVFTFDIGGEYQYGFTNVSIYKNVSGKPDSLRSSDEIDTRQALIFTQAKLNTNGWTFTSGLSVNFLKFDFKRFVRAPVVEFKKEFSNQFAPRFSIMKKFSTFNIYSGISKGFSPPSTNEFFPTGNEINTSLNAETGINYEVGLKGRLLYDLMFDVNAFIFSLKNTIVQRRTAGGGDYFLNAGKTNQKGIETTIRFPYYMESIKRTNAWLSYSLHDFRYVSFQQLNADYSGRKLPSEPVHNLSAGFDRVLRNGFHTAITWTYTGKIALNDSNTVYAEPYHLVTAKLSYKKQFSKMIAVKISAGIENLLDERYSLGNDVNAFGGRYFNAAPGRSYYLTIAVAPLPPQREGSSPSPTLPKGKGSKMLRGN